MSTENNLTKIENNLSNYIEKEDMEALEELPELIFKVFRREKPVKKNGKISYKVCENAISVTSVIYVEQLLQSLSSKVDTLNGRKELLIAAGRLLYKSKKSQGITSSYFFLFYTFLMKYKDQPEKLKRALESLHLLNIYILGNPTIGQRCPK